MQKEDWLRIGRLIGLVYMPIIIFVIGVFFLVLYQSSEIEEAKQEIGNRETPAPPLDKGVPEVQ